MISCPFKPRWERRKDARPQELLAAALDLFVERGFAATRLDDVARAAGVSKGTLYLYFCSKEELFKAVVRESVLPIIGEAEDTLSQFDGNSADLFRLMVTNWWQKMGLTKLSGLPKLMMAEACNFPDLAKFYQDEVLNRADALMMEILRRGISRGEFRAMSGADLEVNARLLTSPVVMMMIWKHSPGACQIQPQDLGTYLENYIQMALRSIAI